MVLPSNVYGHIEVVRRLSPDLDRVPALAAMCHGARRVDESTKYFGVDLQVFTHRVKPTTELTTDRPHYRRSQMTGARHGTSLHEHGEFAKARAQAHSDEIVLRGRAVRTVADQAVDAEDLSSLLSMLGLDNEGGKRHDA